MNRCGTLLALLGIALSGCNESAINRPLPDAGPPIAGLTAEQAARVVARIGDRAITLGDFAKALERMDQFDRLRYQSKERRRELLNEMIDVELLATEAKRRGLDKDKDTGTAEAVRVILRDAMLAEARQGLPTPAEISEADIIAYYNANLDKFREPERRRVAAIVMTDKKEAAKVLKEAQKLKSAVEWGELFSKRSMTALKSRSAGNATELVGDLGIVGPPGDSKGASPRVPVEARAAIFKLDATVGAIYPELVEADGKQYILRLNGITESHQRTVSEAARSIRMLLAQEKIQERERALEVELRKQFPVQIDDKALALAKMPSGMDHWFSMDPGLWAAAHERSGANAPAATGGTPQAPPSGSVAPDARP